MGLLGNAVHEVLGQLYPRVRREPEFPGDSLEGPVEEVNYDAFPLGDFDGGHEVAIPRNQRRVRDPVLAAQQGQIQADIKSTPFCW